MLGREQYVDDMVNKHISHFENSNSKERCYKQTQKKQKNYTLPR